MARIAFESVLTDTFYFYISYRDALTVAFEQYDQIKSPNDRHAFRDAPEAASSPDEPDLPKQTEGMGDQRYEPPDPVRDPHSESRSSGERVEPSTCETLRGASSTLR